MTSVSGRVSARPQTRPDFRAGDSRPGALRWTAQASVVVAEVSRLAATPIKLYTSAMAGMPTLKWEPTPWAAAPPIHTISARTATTTARSCQRH